MDPDFARGVRSRAGENARGLRRRGRSAVRRRREPARSRWSCAAANVVEAGDRVVVVNTGFFGDRMGRIVERLGATRGSRSGRASAASRTSRPSSARVARAVQGGSRSRTSTRRHRSWRPIEAIAKIGRKHGALVIVDGVCATGGETFRQDAWGVDVCLTASQKAIGVPPGLALVVASPAAMAAWRARKSARRVALPRLRRVASDHGVVRARGAAVLRDAGREPRGGARGEPRAHLRRGHRRAPAPARARREGLPRGRGGRSGCRRFRRARISAHTMSARLVPGGGRRVARRAGPGRGGRPRRRPAPGREDEVLPRRPHGRGRRERHGRHCRGDRASPGPIGPTHRARRRRRRRAERPRPR